ncbi:hypothetical protein GWI33_003054, partial [Rhynchophorus ferrugineus]
EVHASKWWPNEEIPKIKDKREEKETRYVRLFLQILMNPENRWHAVPFGDCK